MNIGKTLFHNIISMQAKKSHGLLVSVITEGHAKLIMLTVIAKLLAQMNIAFHMKYHVEL